MIVGDVPGRVWLSITLVVSGILLPLVTTAVVTVRCRRKGRLSGPADATAFPSDRDLGAARAIALAAAVAVVLVTVGILLSP